MEDLKILKDIKFIQNNWELYTQQELAEKINMPKTFVADILKQSNVTRRKEMTSENSNGQLINGIVKVKL
jgi:hypothetical protein